MKKKNTAICILLISLLVNVEAAVLPSELTDRQIINLTAFAKTYGYVRYFHPTKNALQTDWNDFLIMNIASALYPTTDEELITFLNDVFKDVAPSVHFVKADQLGEYASITGKVQYWFHKGAGLNQTKQSVYKSEVRSGTVEQLKSQYDLDFSKPHIAELVNNISIVLPVAVPLKNNKGKILEEKNKSYNITEWSVRLAGVIIAWNELQHFYPYWDLLEVNWNTALNSSLKKAYVDSNGFQFEETLKRMIIPLRDGHGHIINEGSDQQLKAPPLWPVLAEGKIVVQNCSNCDELGIQPGDEIYTINGDQAIEVYSKKAELISGSSQWKKNSALASLLTSYSENDSIEIELINENGITYKRKLFCSERFVKNRFYKYEKIEEIKEGIFYISVDRITTKDFKKAIPRLKNAKGLIFELKRYPAGGTLPLKHLTDKTITSARWNVPQIIYPDQKNRIKYDTSGRWKLKPLKPYLGDKKIVFITSGRAISYAESYTGIVEHYQLGDIVGEEATAGTNGNVNYIKLPGNLLIVYTGMKVLKHDGSRHHLIGIQPTHPTKITVEAIHEGRDELFEKALSIVEGTL